MCRYVKSPVQKELRQFMHYQNSNVDISEYQAGLYKLHAVYP
jgi:hypothetical protein